ncbi:hypothetical protein [Amycolatopsis magusensis]|uniref:hypothetical protein n=1 Tax=Amycolatopsis magusensis TaxID=882444 RepID=UPI0024A9D817|nr:hypothetical protein [Amycolatopsis magusensis]MDI5982119.1 hypothetical protein [Amycolatopsis magusensis]
MRLAWSPVARTDDDRSIAIVVDLSAQGAASVEQVRLRADESEVRIAVYGTKIPPGTPRTMLSVVGEFMIDLGEELRGRRVLDDPGA